MFSCPSSVLEHEVKNSVGSRVRPFLEIAVTYIIVVQVICTKIYVKLSRVLFFVVVDKFSTLLVAVCVSSSGMCVQ